MASQVGEGLLYQSLFGPVLQRILMGLIMPILFLAMVEPMRRSSRAGRVWLYAAWGFLVVGMGVAGAVIWRDS